MAKLDLNAHPGRAISIGFVLGGLAFFLAQLIDSFGTGSLLSNGLPFLYEYLLAGVAFAICSLPSFRASLARQTDHAVLVRRSLFASTAAFVLFLVPTLLIAPQISARWLVFFYALSILLDWLVWRFLVRCSASRSSRLATYLDAVPYAPFIIAGLVLFAFVFLGLLFDQPATADQMAYWAYGFLVLGVVVASLRLVPIPSRVRNWEYFPEIVVGSVIVAVLIVGYASPGIGITRAESSYIVDLNENYLASRVKTGDIVVSDSPALRLSSIPRLYPSLDVQPDERGLALWDDLNRALQGARRVFWIGVPESTSDTQGILSTYLKANGCLDDVPDTVLPVRLYEMRAPLARPRVLPPSLASRVADAFDPVQFDFGAIQLTGIRFESKVCSHDAVAIAAQWRLDQPTREPLKVSLILMDSKRRQIQVQDSTIEDGALQSTDQWKPKSQASGYYLVNIPFGTAPGDYALALGVYPVSSPRRLRLKNASDPTAYSDLATLGQVQVYRPDDLKADPYKTIQDSGLLPAHVELGEGIMLDGYAVSAQSLMPGNILNVTALWRASQDHLPAYSMRVRLSQEDHVIAEASGAPVDNTYPTDKWLANESVLDRWDLRIPPDAPGGTARLEIGVNGGKSLYVADIDVATVAHNFQLPSAICPARAMFSGVGELIGCDVDRAQIAPNDRLGLTLDWRAMATPWIDRNYVVFAQLLAADGHLIAQSDSEPANGERPTRGWVDGEVVQDRHELEFVDKDYRGDARLIVGLYDPATLERVAVKDSPDRFVTLPMRVQVVAPK